MTTMEEVDQRHGIPRLVQLDHLLHLRPQDEPLREEGTAPARSYTPSTTAGLTRIFRSTQFAEKRSNIILRISPVHLLDVHVHDAPPPVVAPRDPLWNIKGEA